MGIFPITIKYVLNITVYILCLHSILSPKNHYSFETVKVLHLGIISLTAGGLDKKRISHTHTHKYDSVQHFLQANVQFTEALVQVNRLSTTVQVHNSAFFFLSHSINQKRDDEMNLWRSECRRPYRCMNCCSYRRVHTLFL